MSKKIKVRFNLSAGRNYMKWKVQYPDGETLYLDPSGVQITMKDSVLKNHRSTALKIFNGEHKTVCAWILCDSIELHYEQEKFVSEGIYQVKYNPRVNPFWTLDNDPTSKDGSKFKQIFSIGKKLYTNQQI